MSSSRPVSGVSLNPPNVLSTSTPPHTAPPSPGQNTQDAPLPDTAAQDDTIVPSYVDSASPPSDTPNLDFQEPMAPPTQDAEMPPVVVDAVSTLPDEATPDADVPVTADVQDAIEVPPASSQLSLTPQYLAAITPLTEANVQDTSVAPEPPAFDPYAPPGAHTHLPIAASFLEPPRASLLASDVSTPRDSYGPPSLYNSTHLLAEKQAGSDTEEPTQPEKRKSLIKRPLFLLFALLAVIIVAVAVVVPVYFTVIKKNNSNASATSSGGGTPTSSAPGSSPTAPRPTTGGDGSIITTETGDTFTYRNPFGGFWVDDPSDPYNSNAQANSWTPPLNASWRFGQDKIYGVNLGGLFVLEPFITPAYYQTYDGAVDEWTLSTLMAADTANGGIGQLEEHYRTFITERDIAEIAGAGLNWIRLPIPFWAIETWPGEPFLARTSWTYILKVLGWARKYGIRVNLDLHTIPGSQNGYNHSGRVGGTINFLFGIMGIANAQRTLGYIRIFTEFISQPEWQPVVQMFGVVNEPIPGVIGQDILSHFYLETHNMIRSITGVGAGNGPFMSIHDGFIGLNRWTNFLPGSDRIALDSHPYIAFNQRPNTEPIATGLGANAGGTWPAQACEWGPDMNTSQTNFGFTYAGEFSNAFNDCGTFVHGVGQYSTPPTYGGDCGDWTDSSGWNATAKAGIQAFAMASMDALQNWFFWTWKIGNATSGHVEAPLWSYQLGLENGWMPTDPRQAVGACAQAGVTATQFDGTYLPWQTGGAGAGTISANATALYGAWPPASLNGLPAATDVPLLPLYTSTGSVVTLPPPTFTASATVAPGDGWFNTADNGGGVTTISGCTYPDPWMATGIPIPAACAAAAAATAAR